LEQSKSIAPLVSFRILFGGLMLFSTLRYLWMGWVDTQLIEPLLHFHYYGFHWIEVLPGNGMYFVFGLMVISTVAIMLGWKYRIATMVFFLCFTYVELIDISFYLNHYYFVSVVAFLMIFLPAHQDFSIDARNNPSIRSKHVSRWCISILKFQIGLVYVYAGLAKINADWLLEALPLAIWLPAKSSIPLIGPIFDYEITPYVFSWAGMLFDTFIVFGLLYKTTRIWAYIAVIIFHALTGILFQIGIFPLVMIGAVTIFFSDQTHERFQKYLSKLIRIEESSVKESKPAKNTLTLPVQAGLILFCAFQIIFPWRYVLYPGNLFWTEEGYRFSWRVMLMEKAGTATFYVKDGANGREGSVMNHEFLSPHQEKQMAMQPDLILQFAHHLRDHYIAEGMEDPQIRAEVWVTLNARKSQLLIDPQVNLATLRDSWRHKNWINPFNDQYPG
jgi:hypothetical protein